VTTLSSHVLDVERGSPAPGVHIALFRDHRQVAEARTDSNGRVADLGGRLEPGTYAMVFDIATYLAAHGRAAPFLQRVTLEVTFDAAQSHFHVPLLITPYACTTYRGT
jgi:5-hydroxyisourate hydrolase